MTRRERGAREKRVRDGSRGTLVLKGRGAGERAAKADTVGAPLAAATALPHTLPPAGTRLSGVPRAHSLHPPSQQAGLGGHDTTLHPQLQPSTIDVSRQVPQVGNTGGGHPHICVSYQGRGGMTPVWAQH